VPDGLAQYTNLRVPPGLTAEIGLVGLVVVVVVVCDGEEGAVEVTAAVEVGAGVVGRGTDVVDGEVVAGVVEDGVAEQPMINTADTIRSVTRTQVFLIEPPPLLFNRSVSVYIWSLSRSEKNKYSVQLDAYAFSLIPLE